MRTTLFGLLSFLCLFSVGASGQEPSATEAWIIRWPYSGGDGQHFRQEVGLIYGDYKGRPGTLAAIRVCSNEPFPQALFTAAFNPLSMQQLLSEFYDYSPERVYFLRTGRCPGSTTVPHVVEPWLVPGGAKMPPADESIKSCQVDFRLVPSGEARLVSGFGFTEDIKTQNGYRAALRMLVEKLKERPRAKGIVLGGYFVDVGDGVGAPQYNRARALMRRRIREAQKILRDSGLPPARFFLRVHPWVTAACDYGCEPQPKFPHLSIIEIRKECPGERAAEPSNGAHPTPRHVVSHVR